MSKFARMVQDWYDAGMWTEAMVEAACRRGKITEVERDEILGISEEEE